MQGSSLRRCATGASRASLQLVGLNSVNKSGQSRRWYEGHIVALVALAAFGVSSPGARGATISYGNFGPIGPGVTFLNVTESSGTDPVPMFGPPKPFVTGLDFDPQNFVASATGGAADITDGQLNFAIKTNGLPILSMSLFERGDFTLVGTGTPATSVFAGAIIQASVTEIAGVPVAPIPLPPVNASTGFNLIANSGVVQPWSLGIGLLIPAALGNVTRVDIVIDNQLVAISQLESAAFIVKKDFVITVVPGVPEPMTLVMLLMGLPMALRRSRGR